MRVIAGTAKGLRLATPKAENIRPVLDQVKEAIFNILFDVTDLKVLDLFAGTGAIGIEALSRGAAFAEFVDDSREALKLIGTNLQKCGFETKAEVLKMKAAMAIKRLESSGKTFDLVFVDPPYEGRYIKKTLLRLAKSALIHSDSIIITEHHPKEPIGEIEGLILTDERKYGQTLVSFLKKKS